MIAADTGTWTAYLGGGWGKDVEVLDRALGEWQVLMAPLSSRNSLLSKLLFPCGPIWTASEGYLADCTAM